MYNFSVKCKTFVTFNIIDTHKYLKKDMIQNNLQVNLENIYQIIYWPS